MTALQGRELQRCKEGCAAAHKDLNGLCKALAQVHCDGMVLWGPVDLGGDGSGVVLDEEMVQSRPWHDAAVNVSQLGQHTAIGVRLAMCLCSDGMDIRKVLPRSAAGHPIAPQHSPYLLLTVPCCRRMPALAC